MMKDLLSRKECIEFGKRAVRVWQGDQNVNVAFEDGQEIKVDAVVGCDGGKGVTRKAVLGEQFPDEVNLTYSGRYVYRGVVPPGKAQEILGKYADDSKIFIGRDRYFAAYPLSGGGFNFLGGRQRDESWTYPHSTQRVSKDMMLADFEGCDSRLLHLLQVRMLMLPAGT
jgi:salicylate hydroxylase